MKNTQQKNKNNSNALVNLLHKISRGDDPKSIKTEAAKLLSQISPNDLACAEQHLINDGFPAHRVQQLSAAFMLMASAGNRNNILREKLPASHILRKVIAEHDLTRCFIADIQSAVEELTAAAKISSACEPFRKLAHAVEHLEAMLQHLEREDDIIFPTIKKFGWPNLCRFAESDHVYIRIAINDLVTLLGRFPHITQKQFKVRLNSIAPYLCRLILNHLLEEENILFPIALELIKHNRQWRRIKDVCEQIGYCGIHL